MGLAPLLTSRLLTTQYLETNHPRIVPFLPQNTTASEAFCARSVNAAVAATPQKPVPCPGTIDSAAVPARRDALALVRCEEPNSFWQLCGRHRVRRRAMRTRGPKRGSDTIGG